MGKIKCFFADLSLKKSMALYIAVFALAAIAMSGLTSLLCSRAVNDIYSNYPSGGEKYYLTNSDGEQLGEGTYISAHSTPLVLSDKDYRLVKLLELLPGAAAPVYSALCVAAAAVLFYRRRLKIPLDLLTAASGKISRSDLDFSVQYSRSDEMGRLCSSFETMRAALEKNNSEMWRQMEERKRLNAAFAHDLRTPLTVLRGYGEMLLESSDTLTRETAVTMERHLKRLEHCVDSMSSLRRLEDLEPCRRPSLLRLFSGSLKESAELVCTRMGKMLCFEDHTYSEQLSFDPEILSRIFDNLLSNAVRYGETLVCAELRESSEGLFLTVRDDGPGFTAEALRRAAEPYFTGESSREDHFGLGLYICRLLCRRHGGELEITNTGKGASVTAFCRTIPQNDI